MARRSGPPRADSRPGDRAGVAPALVGRTEELRLVEGLLDAGRDHGAVVLVHGEAGIGKSALLAAAHAAASGRGYQVLTTAGIESEANLPFAGLHQALRPLLDRANRLAGPQRNALLGAFGMAEVDPAGPFLIGLASTCSPTRPPGPRCSFSSTTPNGSTSPPARSSPSWPGGWRAIRS